jgi:integrase
MKKLRRLISESEYKRLTSGELDRINLLVRLQMYLMLSVPELVNLRVSDFNFASRELSVGGRSIVMVSYVMDSVLGFLEWSGLGVGVEDHVFCNDESGCVYSENAIRWQLRKRCEEVGVLPCKLMDLRRTGIYYLHRNGYGVREISELLGYSGVNNVYKFNIDNCYFEKYPDDRVLVKQ